MTGSYMSLRPNNSLISLYGQTGILHFKLLDWQLEMEEETNKVEVEVEKEGEDTIKQKLF